MGMPLNRKLLPCPKATGTVLWTLRGERQSGLEQVNKDGNFLIYGAILLLGKSCDLWG